MTQMVEREQEHWNRRASCASNPDLWSSPLPRYQLLARHICLHHCSVLINCMQDSLNTEYCGVVIAGRIWTEKPGQLSALNDTAPRPGQMMYCPECAT